MLSQVFSGQSGAPASALVQSTVQQAMDRGGLWTTEDCSQIGGGGTASLVMKVGGGMATKWASTAIAAGASGPLAPIVLAAGGIITLFSAIFGHHAAKVRQERQIICAVVAAVNDSLGVIDQALQQGQLSPDQAAGSLDRLYSDLQQNVQPILKQDAEHCNAACFILAEARGVIAKRKAAYAAIMPANAPPGTWQQTCRYVKVQGDALTAQCDDGQGHWPSASLPAISACAPNSIENFQGALRCAQTSAVSPSGAPLPGAVTALLPQAAIDAVNQLASSTGLPALALWGLGALVLLKVVRG